MARLTNLSLLGVLLAVVSGCPRAYEFTNANLDGGRYGMFTPTSMDGEGAEGEAEAQQPREVVEPDVFRRDGNILYVLNQYRGLALIDLDTNAILCRVPTYGLPRDLYLDGGRAYVLVSNAVEYTADGNQVGYAFDSRLYVVDVEDPENAEVLSQFDFTGDLIDSRVVGDILYAVCAERPSWWGGGWWWGVAEDGSGAVSNSEAIESSWVTSINIADPDNIFQAGQVEFDNLGNIIHCTDYAIFVAAQGGYNEPAGTTITYVDISDPDGAMSVRGNIRIDGYVQDRYKMDAYDGVLRVVAALGWNSGVAISTIDLADPDNLRLLGSLELTEAIDESLFATRFDGARAYVVTYFRVDPLFVLDLSDPANPALLGQLVVPGWSTHIEPRGDRLVTLGVDDTDGKQRVCVSLFDVAVPAAVDAAKEPWTPVLLDRVTFGEDWSWSAAHTEVKAFNVMDDLVLVPFSSGWGEGGYNRLQFVSWTQDGLEARGYCEQRGNIARSFAYNAQYYCITDRELAVINADNLDDPQIIERVVLAENVFDYFEAGDNVVEVISDWDDPVTKVRLHGIEKSVGELELELGQMITAMAYGENAVLVGAVYGEAYKVAVVDCTSENAPALITQFDVNVNPFSYYYGYPVIMDGEVRPAASPGAQKDAMIWPYWPQAGEVAYLVGDKLVLLCSGVVFDTYFNRDGGYFFTQGFAMVDLADGEFTTFGLYYGNIASLNVIGDRMYIGTREDVFSVAQARCAYYLRELNLTTLEMGPAVNVPGAFLDYDPAENILCVRDDQWDMSGQIENSLRSLRWYGGETITPLDSVDLPAYTYDIVRRGDTLFATTYDAGTVLITATIDNTGSLALGPKTIITQDWASLLGARPGSAYMTVNSAVVRYDLADNELTLAGVYPAMGYPTRIRFGADNDYVCLGYSGVLTLPR